MNKNLILSVMLATFLIAGVFATDTFYAGDNIELPQIQVQGTYPSSETEHTYFACAYSLDDDSGYETMENGDSCRVEEQEISFDSEGSHTYSLAIAYVSRVWNEDEREWETTETGTDNSLTHEFEVIEYPIDEDDFDETSFWDDFFDGITDWFCDNLGWFCSSGTSPASPI